MTTTTFKVTLAGIALTVLAACGGGGDASTSAPTSAGPLAKYEGVWQPVAGCNNHRRETYTLAASNSGTTLSNTFRVEYFANADCTGAVVATGTYGMPMLTMQHIETVTAATSKLLTGETVAAAVDRVTVTAAVATFAYTGSGVTSTYVSGGKTYTHIVYTNGSTDTQTDPVNGTTLQAAVLLRNSEFFTLLPIGNSTSAFQAVDRLVH